MYVCRYVIDIVSEFTTPYKSHNSIYAYVSTYYMYIICVYMYIYIYYIYVIGE